MNYLSSSNSYVCFWFREKIKKLTSNQINYWTFLICSFLFFSFLFVDSLIFTCINHMYLTNKHDSVCHFLLQSHIRHNSHTIHNWCASSKNYYLNYTNKFETKKLTLYLPTFTSDNVTINQSTIEFHCVRGKWHRQRNSNSIFEYVWCWITKS